MKRNFKLSRLIFILFIILSVLFMNNVYADDWKTIKSASGGIPFNGSYIDLDCELKDGCIPICGYHYQIYQMCVSGDCWEDAYMTIYYNKDGKWKVAFTPGTAKAHNQIISSGFKLGSEIFIKDDRGARFIVRDDKFDISKNQFRCLNYYFPDLTSNRGTNQVCFSDSDTKCNDLNSAVDWSLNFSKGPNQASNVKIDKTYSIFKRISNTPSQALAGVDCRVFYEKDSEFINDNGEFDYGKFREYFTDLISDRIMVKVLNDGDKDGPFEAIPEFVKNHSAFKGAMEVTDDEFVDYKNNLLDRCDEVIAHAQANNIITEEEADRGRANLGDLDVDDITPDAERMKYYMTYTVKGDSIPTDSDCNAILSADVTKLFLTVLRYIQYLGPVLVVVLSTVDFIKAAASGNPDDMKKAWNKLVKRLIAAILLFFVALITRLLLSFFDITVPENCLK